MKASAAALLLVLPSIINGLPEQKRDPQLLGGLLTGVTNTVTNVLTSLGKDVTSLLGSIASSVDINNKRPEVGFVYQAPGPGDSRGPCPGLNLLANYGYLPRNGYVSTSQVIQAVARGFNMGADLATLLSVFAVLTNGNVTTESWYLGAGPSNVGGLNRHSTVESDVSPSREDYYIGCGDNHHLSSRLFKQAVKLAAQDPSKNFNLNVMARQYSAQAAFSKNYNPNIYYFPFPFIMSIISFAFYPAFLSNGTYKFGGVPNYESVSSIVGAKYNRFADGFEYVPEQWPANWYRRATPYGAVEALTDGVVSIYTSNPVIPLVGQVGTPNLNATTLLCNVYQALNSLTPTVLASGSQTTISGVTWALSKLLPILGNTVLGCPGTTLSPNYLYPNASQIGGPSWPSPPAEYVANSGNNVYNKIFFTATPTQPLCQHTTVPIPVPVNWVEGI